MTKKNIFGPIISRRFGKSLGVDLSSSIKQCNFDCLYCELEPKKVVNNQKSIDSLKSIQEELIDSLNHHDGIDVVTLTANGEPTLYPQLDKIIEFVNQHKKEASSLILSNSSTIMNQDIQHSLSKLDIVKLSLDAISANVFKKIDRAYSDIKIEDIIDAIIEFRKIFKNELIIEILFVKGINDSDEEIAKMIETISLIAPDRVDLSTIDRPPSYNVSPISKTKLYQIAQKFDNTNITVASRDNTSISQSFTQDEILATLSKRPLNFMDIEALFDQKTQNIVTKLLQNSTLTTKSVAGVDFVIINPHIK